MTKGLNSGKRRGLIRSVGKLRPKFAGPGSEPEELAHREGEVRSGNRRPRDQKWSGAFSIGTPRHKHRHTLVPVVGKERDRSERRPEPLNCLLDEEAINRESPVRRQKWHSESWPLAIPDNLNDTQPQLLPSSPVQTLEVQVWGLGRPMLAAIENTYCVIRRNSFWRVPLVPRSPTLPSVPAHVRLNRPPRGVVGAKGAHQRRAKGDRGCFSIGVCLLGHADVGEAGNRSTLNGVGTSPRVA